MPHLPQLHRLVLHTPADRYDIDSDSTGRRPSDRVLGEQLRSATTPLGGGRHPPPAASWPCTLFKAVARGEEMRSARAPQLWPARLQYTTAAAAARLRQDF